VKGCVHHDGPLLQVAVTGSALNEKGAQNGWATSSISKPIDKVWKLHAPLGCDPERSKRFSSVVRVRDTTESA
jgi:hypothetical protein